jgi:diguanylate cyclase (GGDEF)-like protein
VIADLERARKLALNEKRLVVRHAAVALFASLVHTSICLFYYNGGYFAASLGLFSAIFGVIWAGNLALFAIVRSGVTLDWRDPSISMWFALWLTLGFLVTSYYVDAFRISVVMVYFGVMLLAAFRSGFWRLAGLSLVASLGYALVLGLVFADRSINLNLSVEVLQWMIFTLTCVAFCVTGAAINAFRARLSRKNGELGEALEKVREMAIRDELTGLFNRRHIMDILSQQQALADSGDYHFSLCYLDLDHFKNINDTYGHGVGDEVLRRFARLVHDSLREADYTGRLGGEEFVLVLSQTELGEAAYVCERLRGSLEKTGFHDLNEALDVTVSVGVAQYRPGERIDETLARADTCLYRAKESGRNRVVTEGDDEAPADAARAQA